MLRRKSSKWFQIVSSAQSPIRFDEFSTQPEREDLISFLVKKIIFKELEGYISHDQLRFIPKAYIINKILHFFNNNGVIDICDIIDLTGLAGEVIEPVIHETMQKYDGFFDQINRKFYSKAGAISTISGILKRASTYDLKYLLNQIFWTENQLEAVLSLMADKSIFNGYIDPFRHRLYNFKFIDFSPDSLNNDSIDALSRFIQTSFHLSKEVAFSDLSRLTGLSQKDLLQLLIKYKWKWSFVFSNSRDFLFPTLEILVQILIDMYVYKNVPLEFWINRLDLEFNGLYELLSVLNDELKGVLTRKELKEISLTSWYNRGINIDKIASQLHLNALDLLKQIKYIGNLLGLILVAGDEINPFLVKGTHDFDIFCQIDTSSHKNPAIYFECQNCRRIMCSNCRNIESTHECPFCGNISAFIVDLPRYCSDCQITYTHSYNLETAEECYFCKKGPLKSSWYPTKVSAVSLSPLELNLASHIRNSEVSSIYLKQIMKVLNLPFDELIKMLEKLIVNRKINGEINIKKMQIILFLDKPTTNCEVCGVQKTDRNKYFCNSCKSDVCTTCYSEMESVGMILCPECGNKLDLTQI
jgi:hypothetical protein